LKIRFATENDVPTILQLIRDLAEFEKLSHEVVATEELLHKNLFGERKCAEALIALVDDQPAGFALFFHNFSTFLGRPGIYLEDLFVKPEFRSHGIGAGLLKHLAELAMERKCGRLEWSVLNWNRRAIEFYESLGAKPVDGWTVYRMTFNPV
jgi:GNAT superfamily N-acetyltransferase